MNHIILSYIISYYIILYYIILCYMILCFILLSHIMLYYILSYYIISYHIILYFTNRNIYIYVYLSSLGIWACMDLTQEPPRTDVTKKWCLSKNGSHGERSGANKSSCHHNLMVYLVAHPTNPKQVSGISRVNPLRVN